MIDFEQINASCGYKSEMTKTLLLILEGATHLIFSKNLLYELVINRK